MNALFGNLTNEGLEEKEDRIGGFKVYDSDAYTGTVKMIYAIKSPSGAQGVVVHLDLDAGSEYRETFWVTNKQGQNYFERDGKKKPLPGFTVIDDLCLVTTNKPLSAQNTAEKVVNIYDAEAKKEVPTNVPMLVEVLGKKVTFGILKELRNKQVKDASGSYVDTADSREENSTDKVFHFPSNLTVVEAQKGIQQPAFYGSWVERNRGQTRDRRSIKDGQGGQTGRQGRPGTPPKASDAGSKTASLFNS